MVDSPDTIAAIKQQIIDKRLGTWMTLLENIEATAVPSHTVVRFPNSSSYVFSTGKDTFWLVDPAFCRDGEQQEHTRKIANAIRNKISFIVISHLHADHVQPELAALLADADIRWFLPKDCMETFQHKTHIPTDKITPLYDDQLLLHRGITFIPRNGFHKDTANHCDITAKAFDIILPDGIKLFLPGDIRDFNAKIASTNTVDFMFAHVFLGRNDATGTCFPLLDDYCHFITKRQSKHIILTHLYEIGRAPKDLWTRRHAQMIQARLTSIAPDSHVTIPHFGDSMVLLKLL